MENTSKKKNNLEPGAQSDHHRGNRRRRCLRTQCLRGDLAEETGKDS